MLRIPEQGGKLSDIWDGPYEIARKISPVTYELALPNRRKKKVIAHINRLKKWHSPEAIALRVIVADEEDADNSQTSNVAHSTGSELSGTQKKQLDDLLNEFSDVVTTKLGTVKGIQHSIDTKDHVPIRILPYRIVPAWKDQLKAEISSLLDTGIIRPSKSPWSFPMVPVRKPDGSVRLCIDYRKLNAITTPDPYAIPLIDSLIDQLSEATILTKLDMNKGFYQIQVAEADIPKTAFSTPWGKYEFVRMPFGLRNAPATFQRCMHMTLQGMEDFSSAYIDDVIVFSKCWENHMQEVRKVLLCLRKTGLTAKPTKCEWGAISMTYLGHTVGKGIVSIPEAKVEAMKNFKKPKTKSDLRAFLGTIGYYRRFVPGFAQAHPLTEATKMIAPNTINWNKEMYDAFKELCSILCTATKLHIPSQHDEFILHTDASGRGLGAVLSVLRGNEELPVGYYSKKLTEAEKKYAITEMECLAVVKSISHFETYLIG